MKNLINEIASCELLRNKNKDYTDDDKNKARYFATKPFEIFDLKDLETHLLKWNSYLIYNDANLGQYASDIIHFIDYDDEIDFAGNNIDEIKLQHSQNLLIECEKKEMCFNLLLDRIKLKFSRKLSFQELIKEIAIIDYRFFRIHPFEDGNGRTTRMLINALLINQSYNPVAVNQKMNEEKINITKKINELIYVFDMGTYLKSLENPFYKTKATESEELLLKPLENYYKQLIKVKEQEKTL